MKKNLRKRVLLLLVVLTHATITCFAQNDACKALQPERVKLEEQLYSLVLRLYPAENFAVLIEPNYINKDDINSEIRITEGKLKVLTEAIQRGDDRPGLRESVAEYNDRLGLLKKRLENKLTNSQFFGQEVYQKQLGLPARIRSEIKEVQARMARTDEEMKKSGCTALPASDRASGMKKEVMGYWQGNFHYEQAFQKMDLRIQWQGDTIKGKGFFDPGQKSPNRTIYTIDSLRWDGASDLQGVYTSVFEDNEKFIHGKGQVQLTLTGNKLKSVWTDTQKLEVRWKPGIPEKPVWIGGIQPPFTLDFTKQ